MKCNIFLNIVYVFVFLLGLYCLYTNNIYYYEPLENVKTVYFLGDSILDHGKYVHPNDPIDMQLKKANPEIRYVMEAKDNSVIEHVYTQIKHIEPQNQDVIVLSVGGNDILDLIYKEMKNSSIYSDHTNIRKKLSNIIQLHKNLIDHMRETTSGRLYVCTIYYPPFKKMMQFHHLIEIWNEYIINSYLPNVIYMDEICVNKNDFVDTIEPSSICVQKMARYMKSI